MPTSPGVTLNGVIRDISGNNIAGSVVATLGNYGANPPIISGDSELAPTQVSATANSSGVWSLTLFGQDQISPTGTVYTITITPAGSNAAIWIAEYIITSGTYNLANLTPRSASSPIPAPWTYLDAVVTNPTATQTISGFPLNVTSGYEYNGGATSGHVLRGNGTVFVDAALQAGDIPSLPASIITSGQIPVAQGGTGTSAPSLVAGSGITVTGSWPDQTVGFVGGGFTFAYIGPLSGIPATAIIGQLAFITDATAGRNIYECASTNAWTQQFAATGSISAVQSLDVSAYSGSDLGAKLNAAQTAAPAAGCILDCRNFASPQTLSTAVNITGPHKILAAGLVVNQTAAITLSGANSGIIGTPGGAFVFNKGANIDQITISAADVVVQNVTLNGVKASWTGNGIVTASGASNATIQGNIISGQANDAIKDNSGGFTVNLISGNFLSNWGAHAYESTSSSQQSLFTNNYALGDGTSTGAAILNTGSCTLSNNYIKDTNAVILVDSSGAGQPHTIVGNRLTQGGGYTALKMGGNTTATGNIISGGGANGAAVLITGTGGIATGNNVLSTNGHGIMTSSANSVTIAANSINLNLSGVSNVCGLNITGDEINIRTHQNQIQIGDNAADTNYGICNAPTGTHNLGIVFDGDTVSTLLSGGATVSGFYLNNAAGLNTNWQVTVQNLGFVHLTGTCLKRVDSQNNKTLYLNFQQEDNTLDAGTGSTADVFVSDNATFTYSTLPSPVGNGSRLYCSNCTSGQVFSGGSGTVVNRINGNWIGEAVPSWSEIQSVQHAASASSTSKAFANNNTPLNSIIVGIQCTATGTPTLAVSDSANGTYTQDFAPVSDGANHWLALFRYSGILGGANTVSVSSSGNACSYVNIIAATEYSGIAGPDGSGTSASGNSAVIASGSFTVTPGDLAVGLAVSATGLINPGTGLGAGWTGRPGSGDYLSICEDRTAASTTANATATPNSSDPWVAVGFAYKLK